MAEKESDEFSTGASSGAGIADYADRLPMVYRDLKDVVVKFTKDVQGIKVHSLKRKGNYSLTDKSTENHVVFLLLTVDYILVLKVDTEESETFKAYKSFNECSSLILEDSAVKFLLGVPLLMIYDVEVEDHKVHVTFDPTTLYRGRYGSSSLRTAMRSVFKSSSPTKAELQQAVFDFGEAPADVFGLKLEQAMSHLGLAVNWLSNEYPLDNYIQTVAVTYQKFGRLQDNSSRLLGYNVEFGTPVQLPECWGKQMQELDRSHALCIYVQCPVGPVLASITPAEFQTKSAGTHVSPVFKIVGKPLGETGSASALGLLKRSMHTISRSTATRKYVTLNCQAIKEAGSTLDKSWSGNAEATPFATATGPGREQGTGEVAAGKLPEVSGKQEEWEGVKMHVVWLAGLAVMVWVLMGCSRGAGFAILQALLLVMMGLLGAQYLAVKQGRTRDLQNSVSQVPTLQMQSVVPAASKATMAMWTVTILEAEIIEIPLDGVVVSAEAESTMSIEQVLNNNFTARLSMQKASVSVSLSQQFEELSQQYPFATRDVISRYIMGFQSSESTAYTNLSATVQWREAEGIDNILDCPMPTRGVYATHCPISFYAHTDDGFPVVILPLGKFFANYEKVKAAGVTDEDRVRYLIWVEEWIYKKLDPRPNPGGRVIFVVDAKGMAMSHLFSTYLDHLKAFGVVLQHHYVERLSKAIVVNSPSWINVAWKIASSMMNEVTKSRISVSPGGKKTTEALLEVLPIEKIPPEYGGKCDKPIGESNLDMEAQRHVKPIKTGG